MKMLMMFSKMKLVSMASSEEATARFIQTWPKQRLAHAAMIAAVSVHAKMSAISSSETMLMELLMASEIPTVDTVFGVRCAIEKSSHPVSSSEVISFEGSHGDAEVVRVEAVDAVEAAGAFDEAQQNFPYSEVDDGGEVRPGQVGVDEDVFGDSGGEHPRFD